MYAFGKYPLKNFIFEDWRGKNIVMHRQNDKTPHGGFVLCVERTIAWLTAKKHILQFILFPRVMDKVYI